MNLLLVEQWSSKAAMNYYLSSDQFWALLGAVTVLGRLVDVRIFAANSIQNLLMRLKVRRLIRLCCSDRCSCIRTPTPA
jgi:hypothetical protein